MTDIKGFLVICIAWFKYFEYTSFLDNKADAIPIATIGMIL